MEIFEDVSAAESAAAAAWVTSGVLVATALVAWRQVKEAVRLRRAQTRPYLVVQYDFRNILVMVAVRNLGSTMARNVRIEFDRPLESAAMRTEFDQMELLKEGLANMAPGEEIRFALDAFPKRLEAGLPLRYEATVHYQDHDGHDLPADRFVLDLSPYRKALRTPKGVHEVVEQLEKINTTLEGFDLR